MARSHATSSTRIRSARMDTRRGFAERIESRNESSSQGLIVVIHDLVTVAEVVYAT
jgi:hypothetical protein